MNKTMTNDKQTTTEGAAISVQRLVIMAVFVAMTGSSRKCTCFRSGCCFW